MRPYTQSMRLKSLALTILISSLAGTVQARMADISCDDSARLTRTLETVLGAERRSMGLRDPETVLEVWVSQKSGDWTIVQNYSNGTSCIVAAGEHWETLGGVEDPA